MKKTVHRILFLFLLVFGNYLYAKPIRAETIMTEPTSESSYSQDTETSGDLTRETKSAEETILQTTESVEESFQAVTESVDEDLTEKPDSISDEQTYADSWAVVNNVSELQTALRKKEPYIKLAGPSAIFNFGNAAIPITANVTIDGGDRQVAYDGGVLNLNKGLYTKVSGLTIRLQNMTFGSADRTVPALGLYGIMQSEQATELHLENVNYYSDRGAQPLYLRHPKSKVFFHGVNCFTQQKANGSTAAGQEFAEGNNFIFEVGSRTTIIQNTNETLGFLWLLKNPSNITLNEDAEVAITTNHNFIYSNGINNGTISLGKRAKLSVKGTNTGKGNFYYFDKAAFLTVGEQAEISINYPNSLKLNNGSVFRFMPESTGNFVMTNSESIFDRDVGTNSLFEIDSAKRLKFQGKSGNTYNPIGFVAGNNRFQFKSFGVNTAGYQVCINENALVDLTPQKDAGTWTIGSADISRSTQQNTSDFTANEKRLLKAANSVTLERLNPPAKVLAVAQNVNVNDAAFQVTDYQLNGNEDKFRQLEFKLYDQKVADPAVEGDGFIRQKQTGNLADTVTFSDLRERTDYWLYVRIASDPDSQSSEWLEVPFKTQTEKLNVTFPVEVAFHTKKKNNRQEIIPADSYKIDNNSSFAVKIQATDFQELSNPTGIDLLSKADEDNQKDLFLKLTEGNQTLGVLTKNLQKQPQGFKDLAGKTSTSLGFSGKYYGNSQEAQKVQYRLVLTAERKD